MKTCMPGNQGNAVLSGDCDPGQNLCYFMKAVLDYESFPVDLDLPFVPFEGWGCLSFSSLGVCV